MAFGDRSRPPTPGTVLDTKVTRLADAWKAHALTLKLTPSQDRFARVFFAGSNLCLVGAAGTGKSYLVQALFDFLAANKVNAGRTALTGVAAFLIGGQTLHSFCGLGLADEPLDNLIAKLVKNSKAKERMRAIDVLFVDEISMAKGDLLHKVDGVLKWARRSSAPFGGVQLVVSGDFLQLPPIFKGDTYQELAFQCAVWRNAGVRPIILKEKVRQQETDPLVKVLTDIRVGITDSLHILDSRINATFPSDGIEPVRVFCKNIDVSRYNDERLAALPGAAKVYSARDSGMSYHTDAFNRNCPAPEKLELKVGAQVMLLTNLDVEEGYVNGSIGVVKAFGPDGVTVQFKHGSAMVDRAEWSIKEQEPTPGGGMRFRVVATREQIPLRVCYAVTVHKCLSPKAIVHLTDGSTTLERVRVNSSSVGVYQGGNRIMRRHYMPSTDTVRITTRTGKQIICGSKHRLAVPVGLSAMVYTDAFSLKTGDKLLSKLGFPTNEASTLGVDLCWWLGAMTGDGWYNDPEDYRMEFGNMPRECGDQWRDITERLFEVRVTKRHSDPDSQAWQYYCHSKAVRCRMLDLGLTYTKTPNKHVPHAVFGGSREEVASFICGLIDTDGHINKRHIVITNVSRGLLDGTQTLLAILGFKAFIWTEENKYKLGLCSHQARCFVSMYGHLLRAKGKYRHMEAMRRYNRATVKLQVNDLPITATETAALRDEIATRYGRPYGATKRLFLPPEVPRTLSTHLNGDAKLLNRYTITDLTRYLPMLSTFGPTCAAAVRFVSAGLYADEVVSIEMIGVQDLMDLTIETEHQYWADGVLHHNCQGQTLDRAVLDMTEAFAEGQVYVALSRVRNLESLSIAGSIPHSAIRVNPECISFYREAEKQQESLTV